MAVAALSPWPTTPAALTAARTCLRDVLGDDLTDDRLDALGSTAAELVERFAPGAPQAIRNESVIRTAGWLCEQPAAGVRSEATGDIRTAYMAAATGALRSSGAMGLLGSWKVRRAGAI